MMPTIEVNGQTCYYFEQAALQAISPPLVLIHGAGGQHLNWPPQLRRLDRVPVYAPDLPGHGQSSGGGRQSIGAYVADILAFLDALGLKRAIVGGHSMGGAIAMQLALDHPERVDGLVLAATGARLRVNPDLLNRVLTDYDAVIDFIVEHTFGPEANDELKYLARLELRRARPEVVHGDYLACDTFDVMDKISTIKVPTLILAGDKDQMTPVKYSAYLADQIAKADRVVLDPAGHMIMSEFPEQIAEIVGGWIERHFGR
jgi:pimeloyl-ACP methyl ester carboxylesterase